MTNESAAQNEKATPAEKIYIGKGKRSMKFGDKLINCSICIDDLPEEYFVEAKNGKRYLNLTVAKLQSQSDWGDTHTIYHDTWRKPTID